MASYVYAVVRSARGEGPDTLPCVGVTGAPVHIVRHRDLAAVISPVSRAVFTPQGLALAMNDLAWVETTVVAHQRVLAWLLGRYTVAPIKFGTLCADADGMRNVLERHYHDFSEMLSRVDGATEWGVKVYCDWEALVERVKATNAQAEGMTEEVATQSEGARYFYQKRLEQRIRREAERLFDAHTREIHQRLTGVARAAVVNAVHPPLMRRKRGAMILNAVYLVADADTEAFRAAVRAVEENVEPMGLTCELTGPWPPHNFVHMVLEDRG